MSTKTPHEIAFNFYSEGNYKELINFITPYVKTKDSWAEALLGQCYQTGAGVEEDLAVARHFFELSAKQNDPQGMLLFGHHLLFEGYVEEGRRYLEAAYNAGLLEAADYLARSFLYNTEDQSSIAFELGLKWLQISVEAGNLDATHQLGVITGERGDVESLAQALVLYEKAANQGYISSAHNAGLAYANGLGTEIDYEKARYYYAIAADAGLTSAIHNLGVLHCEGKGGDTDKEAAFNCFNSAAAQGSFLSSQSLSKMFAAGEVKDIPPNKSLELAWLMIAEQQAKELGQIQPSIISAKKQLLQKLVEDEKISAISILEVIGETTPKWVSSVLSDQYKSGDIVEVNPKKAEYWQNRIDDPSKPQGENTAGLSTDADLASLPKPTQKFVEWLPKLGLNEQQIHGLFVLVGFYTGTPRTAEELAEVITPIQQVLPHDRDTIINHMVDEFFEEYQFPLDEFCHRSGYEFELRPIQVIKDMDPIYLLKLQDRGLLDPSVHNIEKLTDASRLFQSFLSALGESTHRQNRSIKEAFLAGVYQMQHMGQIDLFAVQQISNLISTSAPLVIGHAFQAITQNTIEYSLSCEVEQIPLHRLISGMNHDYLLQLWEFQRVLFFHNEQRIKGVAELDSNGWHKWVSDRARAFSDAYPTQLVGFSRSGTTLVNVPLWEEEVDNFSRCDDYINFVWGFSSRTIKNSMELLEYKALMIYVVYASLTISRETVQ
jgi:TPR repeat protein